MISDLKARTLQLFRRSSATSTRSSASSIHSTGNQDPPTSVRSPSQPDPQSQKAQQSQRSSARPRFLHSRSRSSLTVPQTNPGPVPEPVEEEDEGDTQGRDEASEHTTQAAAEDVFVPRGVAGRGSQSADASQLREPEPTTSAGSAGQELGDTARSGSRGIPGAFSDDQLTPGSEGEARTGLFPETASNPPVTRTLPDPPPTPASTPFTQPAEHDVDGNTPVITIQTQTQPQTQTQTQTQAEALTKGHAKAVEARREQPLPPGRRSLELPGRSSLTLNLQRSASAQSFGRRSLLDRKPRSPLHQTFIAAGSSTISGPGSKLARAIGTGETGETVQEALQTVQTLTLDVGDYFSGPSSYQVPEIAVPQLQQARAVTQQSQEQLPPQLQSHQAQSSSQAMAHLPSQPPSRRKVWVKRPNASATLVQINPDDLVDDLRDMILRKYANSLGRTFDSPDMTLRIVPRLQTHNPSKQERTLGPEEEIGRTLEHYFPGGQAVSDALLIDVPPPSTGQGRDREHRGRRTPRQSPSMYGAGMGQYGYSGGAYHPEDVRPAESDKDYFGSAPVMVTAQQAGYPLAHGVNGHPSPRIQGPGTLAVITQGGQAMHAIINGNHIAPLPSPGTIPRAAGVPPGSGVGVGPGTGIGTGPDGAGARREGKHGRRPPFGRINTSSPTSAQHSSHQSEARSIVIPNPPPLPTPPHAIAPSMAPSSLSVRVGTPPLDPRPSSPRPTGLPPKSKRPKKPSMSGPLGGLATAGGLAVPPINVLIVEDNPINLRLLEAFLKRLKVRSHSAMNGKIAVEKWREGGFHLVLMDIQLPVMNGLEATKEIRRLERVNGVGAFAKSGDDEEELRKHGGGTEHGSKQGSRRNSRGAEESREAEAEADRDRGEDGKSEEEVEERNRIGKKELFKSPVIIVALTASSLQSDRHEALAAGCNDFLTKPVNLVWLERKLMEWGCMQALIDFDGWRQWKDFQTPTVAAFPSSYKTGSRQQSSAVVPTSGGTGIGSGAAAASSSANPSSAATSKAPSPNSSHQNSSVSAALPTRTSFASPPPQTAALEDLSAHAESADSITTLDSIETSDSTDSIDTTIPRGTNTRPPPPGYAPAPQILTTAPTPQSSEQLVPQVPGASTNPIPNPLGGGPAIAGVVGRNRGGTAGSSAGVGSASEADRRGPGFGGDASMDVSTRSRSTSREKFGGGGGITSQTLSPTSLDFNSILNANVEGNLAAGGEPVGAGADPGTGVLSAGGNTLKTPRSPTFDANTRPNTRPTGRESPAGSAGSGRSTSGGSPRSANSAEDVGLAASRSEKEKDAQRLRDVSRERRRAKRSSLQATGGLSAVKEGDVEINS